MIISNAIYILDNIFLRIINKISKDIYFLVLQVKDLILDNTRSTQIEGLTDEYIALESLSLINVGLTSLKGFPRLPNLQKVSYIYTGLNVCYRLYTLIF